MKITLNKGGTGEKLVKLDTLQIPDLWHVAQHLPEPHRGMILETWHMAHDLKRELLETEFPGILRES